MSDARDRLRRLYENLLEVTDETAQQPVDIELALNLCRQLSSGRGALISELDAQIATLTAALLAAKREPNDFDAMIQIAELKGQVATLTAENNALKADLLQTNEYYYAATDEATNLTHERDELAKTLKELIEVATDVTDWIQKAANKQP